MNNVFIGKFAGWVTIIAGVLLAAAHSFDLIMGDGSGTVLGKSFVFSAHLALVFSFFAIFIAQGNLNKFSGSIGMVLGIVGTIIVTAIVFVEVAGVSGAEVEHIFQASGVNRIIHSFGPLLFVLGMILVGISIVKNSVLPRIGGWLLLVGTIVFAVGTMAGSIEAVITTVGSIFTGAGFVVVGFALVKGKSGDGVTVSKVS